MHRLFPVYYPDIHKNCHFESDELRYFSTLKVTLLDVNNGLGTEQVCCGNSPQYSQSLNWYNATRASLSPDYSSTDYASSVFFYYLILCLKPSVL